MQNTPSMKCFARVAREVDPYGNPRNLSRKPPLILANASSVFLIRSALKNPPSPLYSLGTDFICRSGEGLAARELQSVFSRQAVPTAL